MNIPNFTSLLTALRAFILKSRPAYRDYLGTESVEEKTVLLTGTLSSTGESVTAADGFTGFTNGQTYKATIGEETVEVTAQYGTGSFSGCIVIGSSNVMPSNEIPGWMICVYNENLLGYGAGEWVGKSVEVFTEWTVKVDRWDVKKLSYKLLPDQLFSDLEEMMEKLSSQIKSLWVDPVFTGSFSQNRMSDTDIGANSHAEGRATTASGADSHAEGFSTVASADYQHVEGVYNIDDGANGDKLHIVGNGTSLKRSNAHTLDKSGNAWYAGDVYVGSTSGTNRDAGSKKLATEAYVNDTKLVIASPGGKKFKITVDDTGTLSATEVTDTTT